MMRLDSPRIRFHSASVKARLWTYSFSKSVDRHLETIHLFIINYNLCIQERSTAS